MENESLDDKIFRLEKRLKEMQLLSLRGSARRTAVEQVDGGRRSISLKAPQVSGTIPFSPLTGVTQGVRTIPDVSTVARSLSHPSVLFSGFQSPPLWGEWEPRVVKEGWEVIPGESVGGRTEVASK